MDSDFNRTTVSSDVSAGTMAAGCGSPVSKLGWSGR